ncbi:agmatine deiminase family protein [Amycolatopsis nigrescens]|uniref:agmatine deiminase family protein n=1 Tax=Amycolatopsis nigrescens TaxID=381445 RepID=UPI00058CBD0A|nr:agmatine deiminase family protein [Amycolatopsis nigrescens]
MSRRSVLSWLAAGAAGVASACSAKAPQSAASIRGLPRMPEEGLPHTRTFMAWPAPSGPWGADLPAVREDIARLAKAIARFEPVVLAAGPDEVETARTACGGSVEVLAVPVDDLWMRDTGPTFVLTGSGLAGVDTNFNGWGGKQSHSQDRQVARRLLEHYGIPRITAPLVTEGGSLEVDGHGTLMATESSIVNVNRNPGRTRDGLETDLKNLLGVQKVIWFPGIRGADITDGHIDGLTRFAGTGTVLLGKPGPGAGPAETGQYQQAREILAASTDATGRTPDIVDLTEPDWAELDSPGDEFLASYINYYVANGAVIAPAFGDRAADQRAAGVLGELYPGREIVGVRIDTLAEGGGGIHCATQQQPAA